MRPINESPLLLVADDEPAIRELLRTFLEDEGFSVELAADGGEAIHLLEAGLRPDLLILDLKMPVRDGSEVVRYARGQAAFEAVPILVLSGSVEVSPQIDPGSVQRVMIKPFDLDELLSCVRVLTTREHVSERARW